MTKGLEVLEIAFQYYNGSRDVNLRELVGQGG